METPHGILLPMSQPRDRLLSAADLAELEHHEIVGGELVRKASPSFSHGSVQIALGGLLLGFRGPPGRAGRPGGWWLGSEVEVELAANEVYLPDIVGWCVARV